MPQVTPIEKFWAYLKQLVYEDNWKTQSLDILIERIREKIKSIPQNVIKKFFGASKEKFD
jgi:hypothetical protein